MRRCALADLFRRWNDDGCLRVIPSAQVGVWSRMYSSAITCRTAAGSATAAAEAGAKRLLAALLAAGGDDKVRNLLAQPARSAIAGGLIAEAPGLAKFNAFERQHPFAQRDQVARQRGA